MKTLYDQMEELYRRSPFFAIQNTPAFKVAREQQELLDKLTYPSKLMEAVTKASIPAWAVALDKHNAFYSMPTQSALSSLEHVFKATVWWEKLAGAALPYVGVTETEEEGVAVTEVEVDTEKRILTLNNPQTQIYLAEGQRIVNLIMDIKRGKQGLRGLHPREFEELIAELYRWKHFEVTLTKRTRDGGRDMIACVQTGDDSALRYLIECKTFENPNKKVDIRVVRSMVGVIHKERANKGIVITTTGFTRDAIKEASEFKTLLSLHDYNKVMDWITQYP